MALVYLVLVVMIVGAIIAVIGAGGWPVAFVATFVVVGAFRRGPRR